MAGEAVPGTRRVAPGRPDRPDTPRTPHGDGPAIPEAPGSRCTDANRPVRTSPEGL